MALTKSKAANIFTPEGNSLAVFIDINDGELKLKDVFGSLQLFTDLVGGGGLNLQNDALMTSTLTAIVDKDNTASALYVSTTKAKVESSEQAPLEVESTGSQSAIAFIDDNTSDETQVAVGSIGDILFLRGGSNTLGTVLVGGTYMNVKGNTFQNFAASVSAVNTNLTINSTNQDTYCGNVIEVTGAVTITVDSSVRAGFSVSVIQMDANQTTFAASGSLTLRNRLGNTKTAGQWAACTLFSRGTNLILAGDTA